MILRRVSQLFSTMDTPTVTLRTLNGRLALHTSRMLPLNGEMQRDSGGWPIQARFWLERGTPPRSSSDRPSLFITSAL
jgi:hypothetical protein